MRGLGAGIAAYAALLLGLLANAGGLFPVARIAFICVSAVGLAGGLALIAQKPRGAVLGLLFASSILVAGLFLLARRIIYVVEHGGMDSASEPGSPLAFLLGAVFEQAVVTLPSLLLAAALWRAGLGARRARAV